MERFRLPYNIVNSPTVLLAQDQGPRGPRSRRVVELQAVVRAALDGTTLDSRLVAGITALIKVPYTEEQVEISKETKKSPRSIEVETSLAESAALRAGLECDRIDEGIRLAREVYRDYVEVRDQESDITPANFSRLVRQRLVKRNIVEVADAPVQPTQPVTKSWKDYAQGRPRMQLNGFDVGRGAKPNRYE